MHDCKIREPKDTKDNANVASSDDMSRSIEHGRKVRLYIENGGLWNPVDGGTRGYEFTVR